MFILHVELLNIITGHSLQYYIKINNKNKQLNNCVFIEKKK